jgi:hypothetical protein
MGKGINVLFCNVHLNIMIGSGAKAAFLGAKINVKIIAT